MRFAALLALLFCSALIASASVAVTAAAAPAAAGSAATAPPSKTSSEPVKHATASPASSEPARAAPAPPSPNPTAAVINGVKQPAAGSAAAATGDAAAAASASAAKPSTPAVSYVRELTDENFEHDTQASTGMTTGDWFVEFYAPWCGHCKKLSPIWAELSAKLREEHVPITLAALDATVHTRTAKRFNIRGFPSLRVLSQGRVFEYTGPRTVEALWKFITGREWTGTSGAAMPPPLSALDIWRARGHEVMQDVKMALYTKTAASGVLVGVGTMAGILLSMLVYILAIEPKPVVYEVQTARAPGTAAAAAGAPAAADGAAGVAGASHAPPPPAAMLSPSASAPAELAAMRAVAASRAASAAAAAGASLPPTDASAKKAH